MLDPLMDLRGDAGVGITLLNLLSLVAAAFQLRAGVAGYSPGFPGAEFRRANTPALLRTGVVNMVAFETFAPAVFGKKRRRMVMADERG